MDDIEILKVQFWRDPVGSESPAANGLIYIADATFVAGARPDVQAAYPNYPLNDRAGWGYMMLTNFLPNKGVAPGPGNGVYKLHAIAIDRDGHTVELGTKTISCDNAHATKPFGTIDTPGRTSTTRPTSPLGEITAVSRGTLSPRPRLTIVLINPAEYPSGLRGLIANQVFVGSNPTSAYSSSRHSSPVCSGAVVTTRRFPSYPSMNAFTSVSVWLVGFRPQGKTASLAFASSKPKTDS